MKSFKPSAIFLMCLGLSPYATCGAAEPAEAPLTVAELAQCKVQLAEFNQHVRDYNAKLDEIKALEAEIDALSAALDKESAAVDRRDSNAMQALNAKIEKNNELVERHEQMVSSAKAAASENNQRAAQFHASCENHPLAQRPPSQAQPPAPICGKDSSARDLERQVQDGLAEIRTDEKQHQAEVDRVAEAQAKAQSWSKEKQSKIWLQLLASPKFAAFEREKQPYVRELMRMLGSKPKSGQEECRYMQRLSGMLPTIKAINARQYAFMADEIRKAK